MTIGEKIRKLREKKKTTQKELADKVGVSQPFIAQVERNSRIPSIIIGKRIAEALGADISDIS